MKKRNFFGLSLLSISAIGLAACGASAGSDGKVSNQETTTTQEISTENSDISTATNHVTTESTEVTTTMTEESVAANYTNWHELTKTYEDSDGYIVDLNVKISNWFTNEEQLSNAWNEISNGSEFDAFQPYDIVGSGKTRKYDSDEVLYAVGTLNVVNKTPGYENENRKVSIRISSDYYKIGAEVYTDEGIKYYTTGDTSTMIKGGMAQLCDSYNCSPILTGKDHNPHGYTNTWGTRPFIIALPINKTPKNPEGDVNPEEVKLGFGLQGTIDQGAGMPETINLSVE